MAKRTAPIHYLRPNDKETSPPRILVFDTETRWNGEDWASTQHLRLWCAAFIERVEGEEEPEKMVTDQGHTRKSLALFIEEHAKSSKPIWVYAHNLNFDLAVSELPVVLIERGWILGQHALHTESPWAHFTKGRRSIWLLDSFSVIPERLEKIGEMVGIAKPDLPDNDDTDEAWFHRCTRDVEITAKALLICMAFWDGQKLGKWSITGPSTGWHSFQHMPFAVPIIIKPDEDAQAFERRAIMGGRREIWHKGKLPGGYYIDADFKHAHLTVCQREALPCKRINAFESLPIDTPYLRVPNLSIIAECTINTGISRYPYKTKEGIFYPTGRFKTVLCGPEIKEARDRGELEEIGQGYLYKMFPFMYQWGRWAGDIIDEVTPDIHPVIRVMVKAWSRTVPGKWAARNSREIFTTPSPIPGWYFERGSILGEEMKTASLTIGGQMHIYALDQDPDNCFPAVLAFVQSYTRLYLGRLIDYYGSAVLQTNTDGVLLDGLQLLKDKDYDSGIILNTKENIHKLAKVEMDKANEVIQPLVVRAKDTADSVEVLSPQHVIFGDQRKFAGIPRKAVEIQDHVYSFTVWPKLTSQINRTGAHGYRQEQRAVSLTNIPVNRWLLADGRTEAPQADIDEQGNTYFLPPHIQDWYYHGIAPAEMQHPQLRRAMRQMDKPQN